MITALVDGCNVLYGVFYFSSQPLPFPFERPVVKVHAICGEERYREREREREIERKREREGKKRLSITGRNHLGYFLPHRHTLAAGALKAHGRADTRRSGGR